MKRVYAHYDDEGVIVYQAFRKKIVDYAVKNGTFGKGFGLDRITWIKPSFGWVLQRSKYATKSRMESIAKITISHAAWKIILTNSVQTQFDDNFYSSEETWEEKLKKSDIIHQWDPERDLVGRKLDRRAIQIGLRGRAIHDYVSDWIIRVEDITELATEIGSLVRSGRNSFPEVPKEREYLLENNVKHLLGYD